MPEFINLLGELRIWAGSPSYRTLAKQAGNLMRPPRTVPHITVTDAFNTQRRRLNLDLVVAIVRALGLDEPEVARWRKACVAVHAAVKSGGPIGVFRQLPADLATFTGRAEEVERLTATIDSGGTDQQTVVISAIEGMPGVGKTQLAIHVAHRLLRSGHCSELQLYVDLRGFDPDLPPSDPAAVLDGFLRALEVPAPQIPAGLDERAAMFRDRMHGRHALIVLDNAADEDQIRSLIPASSTCLVLVTSRRSLLGLEHADLHMLDVFTPAEGVALLSRIAGAARVEAEPEAALRVVEACGRLPLAVALAASRLRSRPAWSVEHLDQRLRAGDLDGLGPAACGPRAVFDLSLQGLDPPARRLFILLGLHWGPDVTAPAAAALAGITVAEAGRLLEQLLDEHLLEQRRLGRYVFHDLLRAYAIECAEREPEEIRAETLSRMASWYLLTAEGANAVLDLKITPVGAPAAPGVSPLVFGDSTQALAWFDDECVNLTAGIGAAVALGMPEIAWKLAVSQHGHFLVRHRLDDWVHAYESALTAADDSGDQVGRNRLLTGLGRVYRSQKRLDKAEACHRSAIRLARDGGIPDAAHREALGLNNLATVLNDQTRYDEARAALAEALDICLRSGDRVLEGIVLGNIGVSHQRAGDKAEGAAFYRRSLTVHQETGNRHSEMIMWNNLGDVLRDMDDLPAAFEAFHASLQLARGAEDAAYEGTAHMNIGDVHDATGRPDEAREAWSRAHAIFERLGHHRAVDTAQRLRLSVSAG